MIKETFSATEWEKHFDLNFIFVYWTGRKNFILFWAIFNLDDPQMIQKTHGHAQGGDFGDYLSVKNLR